MPDVQTSEGHTIFYRDIGSGSRPVVLVHGWMVSGAVYDGLLDRLGGDVRLVVPDLRGAGQSDKEADSFELDDYVADVLAVVDHAGVDRFALVGHSMGGQIVQLFSAQYPGRVDRLVLINTVPAAGMELPEEAHELFYHSGGDRDRQAQILDTACVDLADQTKQRLLDDAARIPADCIQQSYLAWTGGGFEDRLADIKAPTLVIASDDPFLPPDFLQAAVVDPIGRADMVEVAGAGHYTPCERTEQTAKVITDFLDV